ncbi:amino acid ABC transporter substrate-binding protein (PAAT family) [Amycolatopsis sulphurea]|uniref:Amino acid ABC transporter substrate-binding protein (PAAT family) n=1 Tax=Amycolatopsis sulphurea TaxID=76022 RepID=A0A2A9FCQ3_9PSEU|nr:ABC transporter substrate-binding protein [Amycolatopsis sulphurea]PFG48566.1 amino acid ABC transporter substrate-binding protein (PAAT family) [Amycolatopsis sulphurea]
MKKLMVTAVAAALVAGLTACDGADSDTLRVGTLSDSRPNAYQENGTYTGFDNELLRAIADKEGLKLEFASSDFSALLGQVASGSFDVGSGGIAQTDERKKTVAFSNPYNYQSLGIEAKPEAGVSDENSLSGKRVGVVQGTVSDTWLAANAAAAQAVRFPNDAAVVSALTSGGIAAAVFDQVSAEDYAKKNPGLKVTKVITTTIPHGFAVRKGNNELLAKLNDGIKKVIADGAWQKVHQRFEPGQPVPADFKSK